MPLEVERKFLITNDGWKARVVRSVFLRDGLIASSNGNKVRVRIADEKATVTIKGPRKMMSRAEFEYRIPMSDAEAILTHMCQGHVLEKRRHFVEHSNVTWEIDVYEGSLHGIVIAEIELSHESQTFELPDWIGKEVTRDPRYRKVNMLAARRKAEPSKSGPQALP
jgi:adenylate cyclase